MFRKYKYHLCLLLSAFGYGGIYVFVMFLTNLHIDVFSQIQGRAFFGALSTFLLLQLSAQKNLSINKKEFFYLLSNSFLLTGAYVTAILAVYLGTPIAKADALIFAYPISVVTFSYLFLKDIPTTRQVIAMFLSLLSVVMLLEIWKVKSIATFSIGELLALSCSFFYSAIIILGRIIANKTKLPPLKITFYSLFFIIPQLWILGFVLDKFLQIPILIPNFNFRIPILSWLILLALGTISTSIPNYFFYIGMSRVKPNVASPLLITELAWVAIFGLLLFGQTLTIWGMLGIAGIILAVLLV